MKRKLFSLLMVLALCAGMICTGALAEYSKPMPVRVYYFNDGEIPTLQVEYEDDTGNWEVAVYLLGAEAQTGDPKGPLGVIEAGGKTYHVIGFKKIDTKNPNQFYLYGSDNELVAKSKLELASETKPAEGEQVGVVIETGADAGSLRKSNIVRFEVPEDGASKEIIVKNEDPEHQSNPPSIYKVSMKQGSPVVKVKFTNPKKNGSPENDKLKVLIFRNSDADPCGSEVVTDDMINFDEMSNLTDYETTGDVVWTATPDESDALYAAIEYRDVTDGKTYVTGKTKIAAEAPAVELKSVKFSKTAATVKQTVTVVAETSLTATKLTMYSGTSEIKSWTSGYTDDGSVRTWKVTYSFSGAGKRTMSFKAFDKDGKGTGSKEASITVTTAPTLSGVAFGKEQVTVKQQVEITAVTSVNATKLTMYSGSSAVKSWTTGYTDKDGKRTWKVKYSFGSAGANRKLTFKAVDANGALTAGKTATITITAAPALSSVKFSKTKAKVKEQLTITAVTSTNAVKLTLYAGGKAVKSWTTGYTDKDGKRTWKVKYAFSGAGKRTVFFKAADANGALTAAKSLTIEIVK